MKQTITESMFKDAFYHAGRKEQFSYAGLSALFDFLEEVEDGNYELDVVALCCDFSEYDSAWDCVTENGYADLDYDEPDEKEETALNYLQENTCVIEFDGGIIIQAF